MVKAKTEFPDAREVCLIDPNDFDPEGYPHLDNLSAAFFYWFIPCPKESLPPEFVYLPPSKDRRGTEKNAEYEVAISSWNFMWEAGHLRQDAVRLPRSLSWLRKMEDTNIYLLPQRSFHRYEAFAPLFHLLPRHTIENFGLPSLKRGIWPFIRYDHLKDQVIPRNFDKRLSIAFAHHVWPLINPCSKLGAFAKDDSLVLLAHNLDFWLPHAYAVAEDHMRQFPRVAIENDKQRKRYEKLTASMPDFLEVERPRKGGAIWRGEAQAWEATREVVERADRNGKLRALIDAIRSNRVEEDFSDRWSFERIDFERKLYSKRSKVKVSFVQLNDTIPVHGSESEAYENLLWEGFIGILNPKERSITVCLRNGITKVGDISRILGYANHSPVSKALATMRVKARRYLDLK